VKFTNSEPPGRIRKTEQKLDHIYYTVFLQVPFTSHGNQCNHDEQNQFLEPNQQMLDFLLPILLCKITYRALLEML
jgi:hypothetical protein